MSTSLTSCNRNPPGSIPNKTESKNSPILLFRAYSPAFSLVNANRIRKEFQKQKFFRHLASAGKPLPAFLPLGRELAWGLITPSLDQRPSIFFRVSMGINSFPAFKISFAKQSHFFSRRCFVKINSIRVIIFMKINRKQHPQIFHFF